MPSDRIVYVDQSSVHDGALEDLKAAMAELVAFVETNVPDILSYDVFFSDDGERMTVIHRHADQTSLESHMEIAGPKFPPIGAYIALESIDVYGHLSEDLIEELRGKAATLGDGRVTIHDHHRGFASG